MSYHEYQNREIIHLTLKDVDVLLEMQKRIYPEAFVEKLEYLKKLITNSDFNIGVVVEGKLVGFLFVTKDCMTSDDQIFLYDIGILPEYQKRGLGSLLLDYFCKMALKKNLKIYICCRGTSYPMFSNREKLEKMGYKIARYEFEKDGYFEAYGIHEDSHEIYLEPL